MAPSQAVLLRQVERLQEIHVNKTCAECCQRDSCWASIIHAPVKGGVEMGVFICGRCYKHHSSLGGKYVVVKSLSQATPWTDVEVKIFERTGNKLVNAIFEAKLTEGDRSALKEIITTDRKEEAEARLTFITRKYKELKYFCEKEYKRQSVKIARAGEDDDDDPEEKVRDNRRAMLLGGGSLSMRQLPSAKKPADDLSSSSTHSTRSTRSSSRTKGVLNRAASQRSLAMRKSNSNRDLMGRLNKSSLGSSPSKHRNDEKQLKLENSSTNTADTEASESSEEQDPLPPPKRAIRKSASLDERLTTQSIMADCQQSSKSCAQQDPLPPSKRSIRKSSSMDERPMSKSLMADCRQNSLKGMRKSLSGRNLNNLSNMRPKGRSLSSRNLMQLPSALQVQKGPGEPRPPNPHLRKALSAKNLMGREEVTSSDQSGPRALKKSPSGRSLGRPGMRKSFSGRSLKTPDGSLLTKSFSGRSLIANDEGAKPNSPSFLEEQHNTSLRDLRKSLSSKDLQAQDAEPSGADNGPGTLKKTPSSGSLMRPQMRKSFSGKSLKPRDGSLRKSLSGRSLTVNDASDKLKNAEGKNNLSPKGLRKSLSSKDFRARNEGANNLQSPARKKPKRAKSMRSLLSAAGSASGGNRPGMRKSFSGRSLGKPSVTRKDSKEKDQRPDNPQATPKKAPARSKSMKSLLGASGSKGSAHKRASLDNDDTTEKRGGLKKSMSFRGLRPSKSSDGLAGPSNQSLRMQRSSSGRNLMKDGPVGGSSHSARMQRTSSGRNLLGNNPDGGSGRSMRMQRTSSGCNLMGNNPGGGSDHSMRRSSSGRNLSLNSPQAPNPKPTRREQSILVRDLDADTLCPSRRDLYDPEAKGLALLMQDSDKSMMGLSFSGGEQFNYRNGSGPPGPLGRSSSPQRYSSPVRPGRSGDAVEVIQEECDDSKHDQEGQGCLNCSSSLLNTDTTQSKKKMPRRTQSAEYTPPSRRDSDRERRSSFSHRRHSNETSYNRGRSRYDEESPSRRVSFSKDSPDLLGIDEESNAMGGRGRDKDKHRRNDMGESSRSSHKERRRSRSPTSRSSRSDRYSGRDSLGGSNGSSHHRHSHKERRRSRSPTSRSSRSDRHDRRGSEKERSSDDHRSCNKDSRHSRRSSDGDSDRERSSHRDRRGSGSDYAAFFEEVDRFIQSVGDVNHEDFWWKMIDKWVESA